MYLFASLRLQVYLEYWILPLVFPVNFFVKTTWIFEEIWKILYLLKSAILIPQNVKTTISAVLYLCELVSNFSKNVGGARSGSDMSAYKFSDLFVQLWELKEDCEIEKWHFSVFSSFLNFMLILRRN